MENITYRNARASDIPGIYQLVEELAIFEKAAKELVCSQERYLELLEEGIWKSFVCVQNSKILGACIYYYGFSTWKGKFLYLEDFIVSESARNKGLGGQLFDQLIDIAVTNNCELMRWQVLDWNVRAIDFYKRYPVSLEEDWVNCRLMLSDHQ